MSDPATMDKVFDIMKAGKANIVAFPGNTADMSTILQRGEVCLGALYDGRIIELRLAGVPLALAVPKEGSVAAVNGYTIATGSKNIDLAYKFLKFVADPDSQAAFANRIFYATSNLKTPYGDTFLKNRPDQKPDFDNMIWLDNKLLAQRATDWQYRWEAIFR
jgi:spermidine/putrescine-binding protein